MRRLSEAKDGGGTRRRTGEDGNSAIYENRKGKKRIDLVVHAFSHPAVDLRHSRARVFRLMSRAFVVSSEFNFVYS